MASQQCTAHALIEILIPSRTKAKLANPGSNIDLVRGKSPYHGRMLHLEGLNVHVLSPQPPDALDVLFLEVLLKHQLCLDHFQLEGQE